MCSAPWAWARWALLSWLTISEMVSMARVIWRRAAGLLLRGALDVAGDRLHLLGRAHDLLGAAGLLGGGGGDLLHGGGDHVDRVGDLLLLLVCSTATRAISRTIWVERRAESEMRLSASSAWWLTRTPSSTLLLERCTASIALRLSRCTALMMSAISLVEAPRARRGP
jgi:hypothetical protein